MKNPAEKMRTPFLFFEFLNLRKEEDAEETTEQKGSLDLINLTEHLSIFLICLAIENGKTTLNFPFLLVLTCCLKLAIGLFSSLHSTSILAPEMKW